MRSRTEIAKGGHPPDVGDDHVLATTKWLGAAVVPVLGAAFVILYLFPDHTMRLWAWMVCPHMSAFVLGGGYLAGAYFFFRVARERAWHRVGAGFVATTVFSTVLLLVTVLHWDVFTHDHVSFWAWLLLYVTTPPLLPLLWAKNRTTDGRALEEKGDVTVPRSLRIAVGAGGAVQLAFAAVTFLSPDVVARNWPWAVDVPTLRAITAFLAFPAATWLWFWFDHRWSSFRITQQTAMLGLGLILLGTLRSSGDFRTDGWFWLYLTAVALALALNVTLYGAMQRRAHRALPPRNTFLEGVSATRRPLERCPVGVRSESNQLLPVWRVESYSGSGSYTGSIKRP